MKYYYLGTAALLLVVLMAVAGYAQVGPFQPGANPLSNQAWHGAAITPSDTVFFTPTRALFTGGAGASGTNTPCNIVGQLNGDNANITYVNVQAGEILPFQFIRVAAATTCINIVALY